jgi:hypothetical protein
MPQLFGLPEGYFLAVLEFDEQFVEGLARFLEEDLCIVTTMHYLVQHIT